MLKKILYSRNFLLYAIGQGISNLGSLMTHFALSLYCLAITNSPAKFALVLSLKYIPQIFIYPLAGVLVDRVNRKKLMIGIDTWRGIFLMLVIGLVFWTGKLSFGLVIVIVLVNAVSEAFYNPATNSIMPLLFEDDELVIANSFSSWVQNLSLLVGPALGTMLYSKAGIIPVLMIDAVSFFVIVVFTIFIKFKTVEKPVVKGNVLFDDFKQGLKLILQYKDLMYATLGVGCSRFFINSFYIVGLPILIIKILKAPEYTYGLAQTFILVGALASPALVVLLKKRYSDATSLLISRMGKLLPFSILVFLGLYQFREFLSGNLILLTVFFATICFLGMIFNSSGFTFLNTYYQRRVPKEYLGRFASTRFLLYSILEPLGINLFGYLFAKVNLFYTLILVLAGAILETVMLFAVREKEMTTKIEF